MNVTDDIIAYEQGKLNEKGTKKLFQHLVDTGMAWRLQGSYGRMARDMIQAGVIKAPKKRTKENSVDYYGNKIPYDEWEKQVQRKRSKYI